MKTSMMIIASFFVLSAAHGASYCNAGGADPLVCRSADAKTVINVHPRFYYGLGLSGNGFCDDGYVKIDGVELNGPDDGMAPSPEKGALTNTLSVTNMNGMAVRIPGSEKTAQVSTAASFEFTDVGSSKLGNRNINNGDLLVSQGERHAKLYLFDDDQLVRVISLNCK